ncbi:RICIN domain-containing protein [Streptomyces carpinensis]|uniref:RICIN domain-containing protein n=1 Tax=Streptomyces carpinensis TaxID=66369 RepID=UPI003CC5F37E
MKEPSRAAQLWDCNTATGQRWSIAPDGTLRAFGRCLDIDGNGTADFTKVQLWDCNGSGCEQWRHQADGSLLNPQPGRCLDIPSGATANGTHLQIYDCNGLGTQKWNLPS